MYTIKQTFVEPSLWGYEREYSGIVGRKKEKNRLFVNVNITRIVLQHTTVIEFHLTTIQLQP